MIAAAADAPPQLRTTPIAQDDDSDDDFKLPPTCQILAQELGIKAHIRELHALQKSLSQRASLEEDVQRLKLKQKVTDKILAAFLQVREVDARIDRQITDLDRMQGFMEERRDKAIKLNTLANIFGAGLLQAYGQAAVMAPHEIPGEISSLAGIGITILLSALSLRQQGGEKRPVASKPNMLAKVLGRPTDNETDFPPIVWTYLNSVPPNSASGQTRLEILIQRWEHYRIISESKKKSKRKRLEELTNTASKQVITIDLLDDEQALLSDLRSVVSQLDRDLLEMAIQVGAL